MVHKGCAPKPATVKKKTLCPCISVCHKAYCDFPKHQFLPPDAWPPGPTCPSLLALLPSPVINVPLSHTVVSREGGRNQDGTVYTHTHINKQL